MGSESVLHSTRGATGQGNVRPKQERHLPVGCKKPVTGCRWSSVQEPLHPAVCQEAPSASSTPAQTLSLSVHCPARSAAGAVVQGSPRAQATRTDGARPHSSLYLAFLQGPWAAGPGSEPARRWPGPRLPLSASPQAHTCADAFPGHLTRVSHSWDP